MLRPVLLPPNTSANRFQDLKRQRNNLLGSIVWVGDRCHSSLHIATLKPITGPLETLREPCVGTGGRES
ncbi:hypothetical protein E2C01_007427 [Portunus trituberculatus]|uniref:Uncharacterized protein n=1 Tax=Portunus trituberculatus TaxID=210409 RepID=A0A5B7CXW7_PORTR|nr:hypothetical protein [Portunus trituberculatus]